MDEIKHLKLKKSKLSKKTLTLSLFLGLVLALVVGLLVILLSNESTAKILTSLPKVFNKPQTDLKVENGRINVLLLGIAGGSHDGATLTDTIMVASYDLSSHTVSLISVPRDIWIPSYNEKINALYASGLNEDKGFNFAEKEIGNIVGLTIPYAIRIDFSGFTKAVDLVGGVDVNVANSFDDYFYPVVGKEADTCGYKQTMMNVSSDQAKSLGVSSGELQVLLNPSGKIATAAAAPGQPIAYNDDMVFAYFGCRYQHLHFVKGLTHMDGTTALEFVRSRHGDNGEGSDFARSRRQQLVLEAFKSKVLSLGTLTDVQKLISLLKTFGASVDSDIPEEDYIQFLKMVKQVSHIKTFSIDNSGVDPLLINPPMSNYGGAWVLVPTGNNYNRIHQFVESSLAVTATESAKPK